MKQVSFLSWAIFCASVTISSIATFNSTAALADDFFDGFDEEESVSDYTSNNLEETLITDKTDLGDLTGSAAFSTSYNYREHASSTGTEYEGFQKLRARINLQHDYDINPKWETRVAAYAFYDFAYAAHGRDNYTQDVLDDYEHEAEFQEVWIQGKLSNSFDIKIGRQIVNWGRSDSLRVLDVLNPLDNREPGLVDIEDIRLATGMIKADYYFKEWNATLIAIPEVRFSKNPPYGSDFATVVDPFNSGVRSVFEEDMPSDIKDTSWAARLMGIYSGWDISFHAARYWRDQPYLAPVYDPNPLNTLLAFQQSELKHSRVTLFGTGANYTFGSWLIKGEFAWLDGIDYTLTTPTNALISQAPLTFVVIDLPSSTEEKTRIDTMVGVEYYGMTNTTFAFEIVNRHIQDFDQSMEVLFDERDSVEMAFRYTQSFINDKLDVTGLIFGGLNGDGGGARADASYELRDALLLSGGVIYYQYGETPPFNTYDKNDRIFGEIKYSF